jgi:hypothetical protein
LSGGITPSTTFASLAEIVRRLHKQVQRTPAVRPSADISAAALLINMMVIAAIFLHPLFWFLILQSVMVRPYSAVFVSSPACMSDVH